MSTVIIYKITTKAIKNNNFHHELLNAITNSDREYLFTHSIIEDKSIFYLSTTKEMKDILNDKTINIMSKDNGSLWIHNRIITEQTQTGSEYNFEITLNAIKRNNKSEYKIPDEELIEWGKNKIEANGIELKDLTFIKEKEDNNVKISKGKKRGCFGVYPVKFKGTLKVNDVQLFNTAIECGLTGARTKHQGFGMLIVEPVT